MGDMEIWKGNMIATSIASEFAITMDEDGCPTKEQPFPLPTIILHRLSPLWKNNIHEWGESL
jgi:hypothetical protein